MEAKEYRTVDKSNWERGPWDSEPDKAQWKDEASGLPCLIVRGPSGALCGYVGVTEGHPFFGKEYDNCRLPETDDCDGYIDVHGGLTFANFCQHTDDESKHICHVPGPGEPDRVWWLGFDCAHSGDVTPASDSRLPERLRSFGSGWETYRDLGYVRHEVAKLAKQLRMAAA